MKILRIIIRMLSAKKYNQVTMSIYVSRCDWIAKVLFYTIKCDLYVTYLEKRWYIKIEQEFLALNGIETSVAIIKNITNVILLYDKYTGDNCFVDAKRQISK